MTQTSIIPKDIEEWGTVHTADKKENQLMKKCIIVTLVVLCGCTSKMTNPAIVTKINDDKIVTIATTADRRIFMINNENKRMCGEPPSGVAENISASLSNTLAMSMQNELKPEIKNAFAEQAAKTVANVAQKTQGMMLFEAMASSFCVSYINDDQVTPKDYMESISQAGKITAPIILRELELTSGRIGPKEKMSENIPQTSANTQIGSPDVVAAAGAAAAAVAGEKAGKAAANAAASTTDTTSTQAEKTTAASVAVKSAVAAATGDDKKANEASAAVVKALSDQAKPSTAEKNATSEVEKELEALSNPQTPR